jgi:hypothetical protein
MRKIVYHIIPVVVLAAGCGAGTLNKAVDGTPSPPAATYTYVSPTPTPTPTASRVQPFNVPVTVTFKYPPGVGNLSVGPPTFAARDQGYGFSRSYDSTQAAKNGTWAVFTVSAVGVTGAFSLNPYDFYVRGADGSHFDHAYANFQPVLTAVTLNPDEPVKGNISFDVPAKTGALVYAPGLGTALGEWQF